jgi:lipopolysaccharide assembly outer membrane protein LptD (OstA)
MSPKSSEFPKGSGGMSGVLNLEWIDRNACLIRLTGNVEISSKGVTLQADEADYHCGTGEVEPRGNVLFKPLGQP